MDLKIDAFRKLYAELQLTFEYDTINIRNKFNMQQITSEITMIGRRLILFMKHIPRAVDSNSVPPNATLTHFATYDSNPADSSMAME